MPEMRQTNESPGDVLVSRQKLRQEAMGAVGRMQALVSFLRDRDDLSREFIADKLEEDSSSLNAVAEATPSIYYPGEEPTDA